MFASNLTNEAFAISSASNNLGYFESLLRKNAYMLAFMFLSWSTQSSHYYTKNFPVPRRDALQKPPPLLLPFEERPDSDRLLSRTTDIDYQERPR